MRFCVIVPPPRKYNSKNANGGLTRGFSSRFRGRIFWRIQYLFYTSYTRQEKVLLIWTLCVYFILFKQKFCFYNKLEILSGSFRLCENLAFSRDSNSLIWWSEQNLCPFILRSKRKGEIVIIKNFLWLLRLESLCSRKK